MSYTFQLIVFSMIGFAFYIKSQQSLDQITCRDYYINKSFQKVLHRTADKNLYLKEIPPSMSCFVFKQRALNFKLSGNLKNE